MKALGHSKRVGSKIERLEKMVAGYCQKLVELQQSETRFRTIVDHSAVAIMFADNVERLLSWNRFTERLLEMNPEDLKLKAVRSFYPDAEWKRIRAMNIRDKGIQEHLETRMLKKNGEEIDVDISISVIKDADNKITGSIGIIRDITERKEAERALQASEQKFRTIFENSAVAIMLSDARDRIISWNRVAERMLDMNGEDLKFKAIRSFCPEEEWKKIRAMNIRDTKVQEHFETKMIKKNGQTIDVDVSITVLKDANQVITGSIGIIRDITERKQAEMERQAKEAALAVARSKSEFFANMSHEMRTPLNGVIGMINLIMNTPMTAEQQEYLAAAQMSAETLHTVINDILDFSKMEAGKLTLECIEFDLCDSVSDAMNILASRAHAKGLELICHILPDVPERWIGDPYRLRQVIINLVGNAIKFTEKGEVIVKVEMQSKNQEKAQLRFSVMDTGIGINANKQSLIFNPFFQADYSTTRKHGGTGLGLSIASQLVRMMGGKIEIESPLVSSRHTKPPSGAGPGSAFHFTLTLAMSRHSKQERFVSAAIRHLHGLSILVVDDHETTLHVLDDMLKSWGMKPVLAQSGRQALSFLSRMKGHSLPFPFALIDAEMPETGGFEVAGWIHEAPEFKETKVMMMHALGEPNDLTRFGKLGIFENLVKPVKHSALLKALATRLNKGDTGFPEQSPAELKPESGKEVRILLVEDNPVNQKVVAGILKKKKHTLVTVYNGKEALEVLEKKSFDIVLMDIQLPEMDGFEATKRIRENEEKTGGHLPVIALTAHAMKGDRERCVEAGMDGYLTKPLKPENLYEILDQWASNKDVPLHGFASPAGPHPPVDAREQKPEAVNWASGLKHVGGDENLLKQVFKVFMEDAPLRMERMKEALRAKEAKTIECECHTLKGGAITVGADSLSEAAYQLELAAKEPDWVRLHDLFQCFEETFGELKTFWAGMR